MYVLIPVCVLQNTRRETQKPRVQAVAGIVRYHQSLLGHIQRTHKKQILDSEEGFGKLQA